MIVYAVEPLGLLLHASPVIRLLFVLLLITMFYLLERHRSWVEMRIFVPNAMVLAQYSERASRPTLPPKTLKTPLNGSFEQNDTAPNYRRNKFAFPTKIMLTTEMLSRITVEMANLK
jgi:hypothetical protein